MIKEHNVVDQVTSSIRSCSSKQPLTTHVIRSISAKHYRLLSSHDIDDVLGLCEQLLQQNQHALKLIAFDWAYRVRSSYVLETFHVFEQWLLKYVHDWYDCDDFCTHAFGELLLQYPLLFHQIKPWITHERFAIRRAAAVVLIIPIKKKNIDVSYPLMIADALMFDDHYLVQKGYGWMLKILSQTHPQLVIDYLNKHKATMPRTAFRYACEKLEKSDRLKLMKKDPED